MDMKNSGTGSPTARGFSLVELLVSIAVTMIVMASVAALLHGGQESFDRESEVAAMQMAARRGMERIHRDLTMAGYRTPPAAAVSWNDGGGVNPDEITILYAGDDVPISKPRQCGSGGKGHGQGPCGTIGQSATLLLDPLSFDPMPPDVETAYAEGMVLAAIETADCNGDGLVGIFPFTVTGRPNLTGAGGSPTLNVNHNPGSKGGDLNAPGGFNREVQADCAVIGAFRMVSYRVNADAASGVPLLERRDVTLGPEWTAVARNIENLQFRYGVGTTFDVVDTPAVPSDEPTTWINRVDVTLTGRTDTANLAGASEGVFDENDVYIRKTFSSMVGLRNVASEAENRANIAADEDADAI